MSLFQNSVLKKYLKGLDKNKIDQVWERFIDHFHNPTIQENIRNSKEEQYQEGFLRDLFVNVLGYTLNPETNFNLTTELKNIKGSQKTDGAILKNDNAIAVIELKGTNTTDLNKVETQAFGYKNNQPKCVYVITSNFEKLRFYIDNAIEFEEFNLFELSKERFEVFWLCLSVDNILKGIPQQIKNESLTQEESVTKKLYKDYSQFRNEIFNDIQIQNAEYDKLLLFKKTQKLLDRFLFIFFAEDRLLLPPNSIREIVKQWTTLRDELDAYVPLYDRFKKYFDYMNTGYKGKKHDIFAYNGGLFATDEVLDNIKISDELLYKHTLNLSNYDFESEVSVNILGHIFEHSLTEIENIQAQLSGETIDKSKSKRKKDGVFYTPKYITKYIVDNTIGKLCDEKKAELKIDEADYEKDRKGRKTKTLKALNQKLDDYRKWLLKLTICDPACGSGAFLNQALEFLISEHRYIDELQTKLLGGGMVFPNVENAILENNLFGVDINEESVEIAKLSLWLRTAQKGRKLTALNNNIKCGNSLIDDPKVAGEKAFNWLEEFPRVFEIKEKEAFHVVLTTHNSRTSRRMMKYNIEKGHPVELGLKEEIALTKIIGDIINENDYQCLAYNVCKDHVHLILVCEYGELTEIVKTIKGKSSFMYQSNGFKPIGKPLWSQKFFRADLDVWKLASLSDKPGYLYKDTYLDNALVYIRHNRKKHKLPESKELQNIIDSFIVNQDHAFRTEYKGGFDVVIGNPPYGAKFSKLEIDFYNNRFEHQSYQLDSYLLFTEQAKLWTKNKGYIGYIMPNTWLSSVFGSNIRKFVFNKFTIIDLVHYSYFVFQDATVETDTYIFKYENPNQNSSFELSNIAKDKSEVKRTVLQNDWSSLNGKPINIYETNEIKSIKLKMIKHVKLKELTQIVQGTKPFQKGKGKPPQTDEIMKEKPFVSELKNNETFKPLLRGSLINRHVIFWDNDYWISYGDWLAEPRYSAKFESKEKLLIRQTGDSLIAVYDDKQFIARDNLYVIRDDSGSLSLKNLLGLLNSKLLTWYYRNVINPEIGKAMAQVKRTHLLELPIASMSNKNIEEFVILIITQLNDFHNLTSGFTKLLLSKFEIKKLTKKLQGWYDLQFKDFSKELKKQKIKLGLSEEAEWMQYFNEQKEKAQTLKSKIEKTDKAIDQMVYELYGLTQEEIRIVEEA